MKTVTKATDGRLDRSKRLAGGMGMPVAVQDAEGLLRRAVLSCLLWEDLFYETGVSVAENISNLIPQVSPSICANIAIEAREVQKLRHVPLYMTAVMAGLPKHKAYVGDVLSRVVNRADELAEFLAIYWKANGGKVPLSKQVKVGLASAFGKFNEYQFAKYRGEGKDVKLRDALQLVHPKPNSQATSELYRKILDGTLETPDTWEVALSTGKNKKETWERLINEGKLGALAFLRNLRNMEEHGVSHDVIRHGFETINPRWLLPLNYFSASKYAPRWEQEIEKMMFKAFDGMQKLSGTTIFIVDVSGSTSSGVSGKGEYSRLDVEKILTVIGIEMCEKSIVYVTAGDDGRSIHKTQLVPTRRGFGMSDIIRDSMHKMGGGGIFTRQALDYVKQDLKTAVKPDRIIVLTDSQDCDHNKALPAPFGKNNYIIDVSAHAHGINYKGVWTAEISGWSEHFIKFIAGVEGLNLQETLDEE